MKPEEYLDRLIVQRKSIPGQSSLLDDDIASSLNAVELLTRMRNIAVPQEFAHRLEEKVRVHARIQCLSEQDEKLILPISSQQHQIPGYALKRRPWVVAIGSVAVLLIVFASFLTISFHSSSASPVSNLRPAQGQVTPPLAGTAQNRADEALEQLESALENLNTVVHDGRDDKVIKQAFDLVVTWTQHSQTAAAALSSDPQSQVIRQRLAARLIEEQQTLFHLLDQVDWSMKVVFTQQLSVLGKAVPLVSHVSVRTLNNGVLKITLRGKNLALQSQLIIDGKQMGSIIQATSSQVVAIVTNTWWTTDTHTIGILCPDGTAAQIIYHARNDGYEQTGTPVATPTEWHHDN